MEASDISFQETTSPTVVASTMYDCETCYKPGKEMLLAECIHATYFLPVPDHQLKEIQREMACDRTLQFVKKAILDGFPDTRDEKPAAIQQYRISSNNSWGRLFLFSHKKGAIIQGKAIIGGRRLHQCISNIAHWKSPKYFVLFSH